MTSGNGVNPIIVLETGLIGDLDHDRLRFKPQAKGQSLLEAGWA
jgi:hypothetical protein